MKTCGIDCGCTEYCKMQHEAMKVAEQARKKEIRDKKLAENILADMERVKITYDNPHLEVTIPASPHALLLDFCHFIGKEGFKINGYDDGMLNIVIAKFLNMQSAHVAQ